MSRILYKYLDITGAKCMIGNSDLQFTNATQLNDPFDCHPSLLDYESMVDENLQGIRKQWQKEVEENRATNLRNDTWLCSLSKIYDSMLMWAHYCYNHKGVCVGLDIEKVLNNIPDLFALAGVLEFEVQYQDIIRRRPSGGINPWHYQLTTKAKDWEYEQEVRLVTEGPTGIYEAFTQEQAEQNHPDKIWDNKVIHQYLPLNGDCFESIYFGILTPEEDKEKIINHARKHLNPNIKLYQMSVDEQAFRLKAEDITNIQCTSDIELKKIII